MARTTRALAVLAVHNEERFIRSSLENLVEQGFSVYLLDHGSTDRPEGSHRWMEAWAERFAAQTRR